jgi:hypothetical protein
MVQLLYCPHLYCLHQLTLTSFPTNCQISKQEEVCPRHNRLVGEQWNNGSCFCEKNSGLSVPCAQYCADGKETSHVLTTILLISSAQLLMDTIQESTILIYCFHQQHWQNTANARFLSITYSSSLNNTKCYWMPIHHHDQNSLLNNPLPLHNCHMTIKAGCAHNERTLWTDVTHRYRNIHVFIAISN